MTLLNTPRIIPNRRLYSIFVVMVLTSVIFVASLSIIVDINNVTNEFIGDQENVFVLYNADSTTPFTSRISTTVLSNLDGLSGIEAVSPEILHPAIVGEEPIYLRAVNLSQSSQLDPSADYSLIKNEYVAGTSVVIGRSLSRRISVESGDEIELTSILTDKTVNVRVAAILDDSFHDDEMLISIELGQFLAELNDLQVTHIRIRFNPDIITTDYLRDTVFRTNPLTIQSLLGNSTNSHGDYKLQVTANDTGLPVYSGTLKEKITLFLLTSYYSISITTKEGKTIPTNSSELFLVDQEMSINLQVEDYIFNSTFIIKNNDLEIPNFEFKIFSEFLKDPMAITTNEYGYVSALLQTGNYTIETFFLGKKQISHSYINESSTYLIQFNASFSNPVVDDLVNDSLVITNQFSISLSNYDHSVDILIDDEYNQSISPQFVDSSIVNIKVDDGPHTLKIRNSAITSSVEFIWNFEVNSSFDYFDASFSNNSVFSPAEVLSFDVRMFKPGTIAVFSNGNEQSITASTNEIQFSLPAESGWYELDLRGTSYLNQIISKKIVVMIDNSVRTAGWVAPSSSVSFEYGDSYPIWAKELPQTEDGWSITQFGDQFLLTPDGVSMIDFLSKSFVWVNTSTLSNKLYFSPVKSYSDLVSLYDKNNLLLDPSTKIQSSELNVSFDDNILEVTMGNVVVTPNFFYPLSSKETLYNLSITNRFTGMASSLSFTAVDITGQKDIPVNQMGYRKDISDNRLHIQFDKEVHLVVKNGTHTLYDTNLDSELYSLFVPKGTYIVNASSSDSFVTWTINVTQPLGTNSIAGVAGQVSTKWGYVNATGEDVTLMASSANYKLGSESYFFTRNQEISYTGETITLDKSFTFIVSNVQYANYTILYSNGTSVAGTYVDEISLESTSPVNASVTIDYISVNGSISQIVHNVQFTTSNNELNVTVIARDRRALDGYQLHITSANALYSSRIDLGGNNSAILKVLNYDITIHVTIGSMEVGYDLVKQGSTWYVYLGTPEIQISYEIPQEAISGIYNGSVTVTNIDTNSSLKISEFRPGKINPGNYTFTFRKGIYSAEVNVTIQVSVDLNVVFPVITGSFILTVFEEPVDSYINLKIYHTKMDITIEPRKISSSPNRWELDNIPLGEYELEMKGRSIDYTYVLNIDSTTVSSIFVSFKDPDAEALSKFGDLSGKRNLRGENINLGASDDYLNSYLEGSLSIINVILITEVIIVFSISLANINVFMTSITTESIKELRILRSLGYSHKRTLFAFGKWLFLFGIVASFIGLGIATILLKVMVQNNILVIFGHLFTPEVNNTFVILSNFVLVELMLVISAIITYRKNVKF